MIRSETFFFPFSEFRLVTDVDTMETVLLNRVRVARLCELKGLRDYVLYQRHNDSGDHHNDVEQDPTDPEVV